MAGTPLLLLATVVVLISLDPVAACTRSLMAKQQPAAAQQNKGANAVTPLLQDVFQFWLKYGPDKQYGGLKLLLI